MLVKHALKSVNFQLNLAQRAYDELSESQHNAQHFVEYHLKSLEFERDELLRLVELIGEDAVVPD